MGLLIRFARQWVAGESMEDAVRVAQEANRRGIRGIVNHLGEHYHEKPPVQATTVEYLKLVATLRAADVRTDVSIKPTQFGILIDREFALSQIVPVMDAVKAWGHVFWVDMESASTIADTLWIHENLLSRYDKVGLCLQANIRRTAEDLARLLPRRARIRLVKGAYKETEDVAFTRRPDIDREYLRHLETLFTEGSDFAVATHDGHLIDRALELSKAHPGVPFEFAMLQGVRDPLKAELVAQGHAVAEYIPYGPTWLPYFTRRLRERPRNIITMARSFVSG
jgi:proline dehydrogenase